MSRIVADRVLETSTTTGTGAITLLGAVAGYQAFSAVCVATDTIYYAIEAISGSGVPTGEWEVGLGTYNTTLTRTTVLASSNSGSAVSFSAGTKRVFGTAPASVLNLGLPFSLAGFFTTTPTSSEVLLRYTFIESVIFADEWLGSVATVGTNPTSSFVLTVKKNGSSVGTITISTGGTATFVTTGTTVSVASGDQISVTAPSSADATVADVSFTLKGTRG